MPDRSSGKLLDSLEIQNFRCFRSLTIERLGNINLVVGKNSVGKSALLEALRLYAAQGAPDVIGSLLRGRDELAPKRDFEFPVDENAFPVANLFYGRPQPHYADTVLRIISNQVLTIKVGWGVLKKDDLGQPRWRPINGDELAELEPRLIVQFSDDTSQLFPIDADWSSPRYRRLPDGSTQVTRPAFIPAAGLAIEDLALRWDVVSLQPAEKDSVLEALQIVVPDIILVQITGGRRSQLSPSVVKATLSTMEQPVPLRSLGEGMLRLFGLALALATAKDNLLLIDEIDSGLHHSVQLEVWRLIFAMAERRNVQVFATTHSWDCVAAFQQVAAENDRQDGMLIRLEKEGDEIVPVLVDEETLAIVTREQIEVR